VSKRLQVYEHDSLSVSFDLRRCIHAAACVRGLPAVFDPKARPWIRPEAASVEEIVEVVHRCPTGALQVAIDGVTVHQPSNDCTVQVGRNGPLMVRGDVRIVDQEGNEILQDTRVALCRCGQSRRKPFCDGAHREAGFRDPGV
jgi:uncharacterized Fe-S cluster protein YjdI